MKTLYTEIDIAAPPEDVWDVLLDFGRYPEWNPFILEVLGTPDPGATLRATIFPPGGRAVTVTPTVTEVVAPRTLEWLGRLGFPGLFDARHRFELHDSSNGTRLVQREVFTGMVVPVFARTLEQRTAKGFVAMNAALKRRAERAITAEKQR